MKTLFAKFKISSALDESKVPTPESGDADIRKFAESLRSLDRRLKDSRSRARVPEGLHGSVMRAVRQIAREQATEAEPQRAPWFRPAWLAGPALALLVLVAVWWFNHGAVSDQPTVAVLPTQPSIAGATELLEVGGQAQKATAVALSPLSAEVEYLKQDLQNATKFLLASLP